MTEDRSTSALSPELTRFVEHARSGRLILPFCSECGAVDWYPLTVEPCCKDGGSVWQEVASTGSVYACIPVYRSFHRDLSAPYVVGLVTPDDVPDVRIVARFTAELAIGEAVDMVEADQGPVPVYRSTLEQARTP